jgi:hypothetical protein
VIQAQGKTKMVLCLIIFWKINVRATLARHLCGRKQQNNNGYNNKNLSQHLKILIDYQTVISPFYFVCKLNENFHAPEARLHHLNSAKP